MGGGGGGGGRRSPLPPPPPPRRGRRRGEEEGQEEGEQEGGYQDADAEVADLMLRISEKTGGDEERGGYWAGRGGGRGRDNGDPIYGINRR
jgi:hypothetical protein